MQSIAFHYRRTRYGGKAVKSQRQQLSLYQRERKDLRYADLYGRYDAGNGDNERKIYKEVRNNVNRSVNCEAANLDKTIAAAQKQADDINYIFEKEEKGICPTSFCRWQKSALPHLSCR